MEEPLFLTTKIDIHKLKNIFTIYNYQLLDHFKINVKNIYTGQCKCSVHFHQNYLQKKKEICYFTTELECQKCKTANKLFINYVNLAFHMKDLLDPNRELRECCVHTHVAPCLQCLQCKTGETCCVGEIGSTIQCNLTTNVICNDKKIFKDDHFTSLKKIYPNCSSNETKDNYKMIKSLHHHLFDYGDLDFYICLGQHSHYHFPHYEKTKICYLQMFRCCEKAINFLNLKQSFYINAGYGTNNNENNDYIDNDYYFNNKNKKIKKKRGENFLIFNPSLWRDQSLNQFKSFLKAVVLKLPMKIIKDRYVKFENSNYKISNLKTYKSGKYSIIRTAVTGFPVLGVYQTAIISCTIDKRTILLPQKLYNELSEEYDLTYVCLKRDPSITDRCMFVCKIEKNPDPEQDVIVISDMLAKPLNQDQDGDKNGGYLMPLFFKKTFDRRESFIFKLSRLELEHAYNSYQTLIASPRFSFSEHNLLMFEKKKKFLLKYSEFFRKTFKHGPNYMINAGCGIWKKKFDKFCKILCKLNKAKNDKQAITINDIFFNNSKSKLTKIVKSGAKGHAQSINMLHKNLLNMEKLDAKIEEMVEQIGRYVSSGQELRRIGRNQFISFFAANDLKICMGLVFLNLKFYADLKPFSSCGTLMFNEASLNEFLINLQQ